MSWPEIDLVVGRAVTARDLRRLKDAAAIGAAVLATAGDSGCVAEVKGFEEAQRTDPTFQQQANWCWAACLQAVLRHYGVRKEQSEIVTEVYGAPMDLPELSSSQLYHVVNGEMPLENGTMCLVRGRAYPGALLTPPALFNELKANHPVMVVHKTGEGTGHAVVIYGATFTALGIAKVKYFDPSAGKGLGEIAGLSPDAMILRWFAIRGRPR